MRKNNGLFLTVLALIFLLSGCSSPQEAPDASPTPIVVEAPEIEATGELAEKAKRLMDPFEAQLNRVAQQCRNNLTYTIPGDMLNSFVLDAQETGAQPESGRYQFTWRQSGRHTYQATGLEVQQQMEDASALETPDPSEDAPMDSQWMGDFSAAGGGQFDRSRAYDVAADLSGGIIEMTDTLNGETTGHEIFTFSYRNDALYFVNAALDFSAGLDGLENSGIYLVAAGVIEKENVEIVEYYVASRENIPTAASLNLKQLLSQISPVSHLTAQGNQIRVSP